jgi:hypothetical protein
VSARRNLRHAVKEGGMTEHSLDYEPGVLRVFQSKDETRAFYNKIAHV